MKLNIAAWPRALGSSLSQSLKEALLPVVQMFVCAGASRVHAMCNLNQAETEEFMNELSPPRPFPHWQCLVLLLRSSRDRLLLTAWLDWSSVQVGGVQELRLGVCTSRVCRLCDAEGSVRWERVGEMVQHRGAIIVIEYEGRKRKLSAQIAACWALRL